MGKPVRHIEDENLLPQRSNILQFNAGGANINGNNNVVTINSVSPFIFEELERLRLLLAGEQEKTARLIKIIDKLTNKEK